MNYKQMIRALLRYRMDHTIVYCDDCGFVWVRCMNFFSFVGQSFEQRGGK